MKYYLIAGEASGDLHGSNLIKAIKQQDAQAALRCWGGDLMRQAGATVVKHYRDLAFMGFVEVVKHLGTILKNLRFCREDITQYAPDVLVLIDYPGFNLRIAEWAKKQGIKVCYYISPQIWAWKENRINQIKQSVDKMLVILPFEKDFYQKHLFPVTYVGHPLTQVVDEALQKPIQPLAAKPIIAVLPGSRQQEIKRKLPVMLAMVPLFPDYQFIIAQAPGQPAGFYQQFLKGKDVQLVQGQTYNLLGQSVAALVTSGTATLETALFGVPQVVCYKGNPLSYLVAKKLIKVQYISLVNLILDKPAVRELIQQDLNVATLKTELYALLHDRERQETLQLDYTKLWELLSGQPASDAAAKEVVALAGK
ncbi:MAG: lipid-A-disaccharide synthase [Edaphocola sp.]